MQRDNIGSTVDRAKIKLTIRLFGGFEVQIDGQPIPQLRTRKGRWLLALLALRHNCEVERSWLAGVLWPESGEKQAHANLRLSLTDLRRAMGSEAVRIQPPTAHTICFHSTGAFVDVLEFDGAIAGDIDGKRDAIGFYRGPLLEGCVEEWAVTERDAREQSYLNALTELAGRSRQQRDVEGASQYLRLILAADPYRESALCALMEACFTKGDYAAVTAVYRDFRIRLHRDLNVQLHEETTELYRRLTGSLPRSTSIQASTSSLSPALSAFPTPISQILGREKEIREVCASLQTSRLVTLIGPGGSGKTRLSLAVGQCLMDSYRGQVCFVSLAELSDATRLSETLRDTLHLPQNRKDPFEQIIERLSMTPCLLVLDNFEHLVEQGAPIVEALMASAPLLTCLVTSRHALDISGESEYRVRPLELPAKKALFPQLLQCSSIQLFLERAASRKSDFRFTPDNSDDIVAICAKLEGIPLAIELVAAWSDVLTPAQMFQRLEARFAFPRNAHNALPERQRSLQKAFDGSYSLLEAAERRLLRELSIFTGGWTLEAAEAICSTPGVEPGEKRQDFSLAPGSPDPQSVLVLLKRLREKSLVLFQEDLVESCGQSRYQLLEMTRQYAREQLSSEESKEIEKRHAAFFLAAALGAEADILQNGTVDTQKSRMKPDWENYDAALQKWRELDANRGTAMMLALNSCRIWAIQSQQQNDMLARLETQPLPAPSPLQAKLYIYGSTWGTFNNPGIWKKLTERAFALAEGCGDLTTMALALCSLGEADVHSGDLGQARERLEMSRQYFAQIGLQDRVAYAQKQLVYLDYEERCYGQAWERAKELLRMGRAMNHWSTQAQALEAMGYLATKDGEYATARAYLEDQLSHYPKSETLFRSNSLRAIGKAATLQEDYEAGRFYLFEALDICRQTEDHAHEAWTYHDLAFVAHREGDDVTAIVWTRKALQIFVLLEELWSAIVCIRSMARYSGSRPELAAFLWVACERMIPEAGYQITAEQRNELTAACAALQQALTPNVFSNIRKLCDSMHWQAIVRHAIAS